MTQNTYNPEGKKTGYWEEECRCYDSNLKQSVPGIHRGHYLNGRKTGDWTMFLLDETVIRICSYKEGFPCGEVSRFRHDYNGRSLVGQYDDNGDKTGIWKSYFRSGAISHLSIYNGGKTVGIQKQFRENGELSHEKIHIK